MPLCLRCRTLLCLLVVSSFSSINAIAQSQTTGRLVGVVRDQNGGVIAGVTVTVTNLGTGDQRRIMTDAEGNYAVTLLFPGAYRVSVAGNGFVTSEVEPLHVKITETTTRNVELLLSEVTDQSLIRDSGSLIQTGGPQLGHVVGSRMVSELPLATRNVQHIFGQSPGTSVDLPNNSAVGRNSLNISVNGARVTSNSFQINGVDANNIGNSNAYWLAVPAPETILEFKVQTSLYDATYGRSGGGNIQVVTRSGGNNVHGAAYEYFRHRVLNANNPFLKAAGIKRPELSRHVFGALTGGPIKRDKAFFFVSYQGTSERNAASSRSLSESVYSSRPDLLTTVQSKH